MQTKDLEYPALSMLEDVIDGATQMLKEATKNADNSVTIPESALMSFFCCTHKGSNAVGD